jgi:hypothetical protein
MKIEMAHTARRTALTAALAGALLGFAAPAASADSHVQDGPSYVIDGVGNGNGPDAFIVSGNGGREPVFFCAPDNLLQQHRICLAPIVANGPRF